MVPSHPQLPPLLLAPSPGLSVCRETSLMTTSRTSMPHHSHCKCRRAIGLRQGSSPFRLGPSARMIFSSHPSSRSSRHHRLITVRALELSSEFRSHHDQRVGKESTHDRRDLLLQTLMQL